jgi:hypothetical protein
MKKDVCVMQLLDLKVSDRYVSNYTRNKVQAKVPRDEPGCRQLTLAFYRPGPEDQSWMNRLVVWLSRNPYSHCELIFENGLATSIMHGENVFCKKRTFASAQYVFKGFNVSHATHEKIYQYACLQSNANIPFSTSAMLSPALGVKLQKTPGGTFCSKYIVEVLQHGGVPWALNLDADLCSPSSLFDALKNERNVCFNTVPYRLNQLKIVY